MDGWQQHMSHRRTASDTFMLEEESIGQESSHPAGQPSYSFKREPLGEPGKLPVVSPLYELVSSFCILKDPQSQTGVSPSLHGCQPCAYTCREQTLPCIDWNLTLHHSHMLAG